MTPERSSVSVKKLTCTASTDPGDERDASCSRQSFVAGSMNTDISVQPNFFANVESRLPPRILSSPPRSSRTLRVRFSRSAKRNAGSAPVADDDQRNPLLDEPEGTGVLEMPAIGQILARVKDRE